MKALCLHVPAGTHLGARACSWPQLARTSRHHLRPSNPLAPLAAVRRQAAGAHQHLRLQLCRLRRHDGHLPQVLSWLRPRWRQQGSGEPSSAQRGPSHSARPSSLTPAPMCACRSPAPKSTRRPPAPSPLQCMRCTVASCSDCFADARRCDKCAGTKQLQNNQVRPGCWVAAAAAHLLAALVGGPDLIRGQALAASAAPRPPTASAACPILLLQCVDPAEPVDPTADECLAAVSRCVECAPEPNSQLCSRCEDGYEPDEASTEVGPAASPALD